MMRKLLAGSLLALSLIAPSAAYAQVCPAVAALPDTERRVTYSPSASTGPFSITFPILGDSTDAGNWLEVWLNGTKLTFTTQWTFSLSGGGSAATACRPITTGQVTLITAATGTLEIVGARRPRRTSQFAENRGVSARDLNQVITDLTAMDREAWDLRSRSLLTKPGDTIGNLPTAAVRAGGVLCFDSSGNPLACTALTGLGNVVGPNVSVVGHIATFANTTGTLIQDGGLIGAGDFTGPAGAALDHIVTFAGATGKIGKDSGLTLTPSTGTITLSNAKTLTVSNTLTLTATDGSTAAFGTGGTVTYTANNLSVFAATTSAQLAGVISDETGTGSLVFGTNGSLNIATPGALAIDDSQFTIRDNGDQTKVVNFQASGITTGTTRTFTFPDASDTFVGKATTDTLTNKTFDTLGAGNVFRISGTQLTVVTGTGSVVLHTSPTLVTPTLGVATATTLNKVTITAPATSATLTIADGKTFTASNTITLTAAADGNSFAFPSGSDTIVTLGATQTLTNKTLTSPTINGGAATGLTALCARSSGSGAFDICLNNTENLTAPRTLTLKVNNAGRSIDISGNIVISADFTTSGPGAITLNATGGTNVTLPTSGTLATRDTSQTFSGSNTFSSLQTFTDIRLSSGKIYPLSDGTTALQVTKADGTTRIINVDTTNARVGINKNAGAFDLDVNGALNIGGVFTFGTIDPTSLGTSTTTVTGLTINNSPSASNDYIPYYSATDGRIRRATVGSIASGATAGVAAVNGLTGSLSLSAGTGMQVTSVGTTLTVIGSLSNPQGRLTLTSGTAITTADVTGATTHYYALAPGRYVPITTDGTNYTMSSFTELSQTTADATKSPYATPSNAVMDIWLWNDSGTLRATRGPFWSKTSTITVTIASPAVVSWTAHGLVAGQPVIFTTSGALPTGITSGTIYYVIAAGLTANAFEISATVGGAAINTSGTQSGTHTAVGASDTSRGTGAGTTEVDFTTQFPTNKNAITNGPAANRGILVGCVRSNAAAQLTDSDALRWVSNVYNAVPRRMQVLEATATWNYTTATFRQANGVATNQLDFLQCLPGGVVTADVTSSASNNATGAPILVGIDLDTLNTTALTNNLASLVTSSIVGGFMNVSAKYSGWPGIGRHTLIWKEYSGAVGVTTWQGNNSGIVQSGIVGQLVN